LGSKTIDGAEFSLKQDWTVYLLDKAFSHPNPLKLFIDHKFYWERSHRKVFETIITYITQKLDNFTEPEVLEAFLDWLHANGLDSSDRLAFVFDHLSKALSVPECEEKVTNFLIDTGKLTKNPTEDADILQISRRSLARNTLKKLKNDNEIRDIMYKMLASENLIPLKIDLMMTLDDNTSSRTSSSVKAVLAMMHVKYMTKDNQYIDVKTTLIKILEVIKSERADINLRIHALSCLYNCFFNLSQEFPAQKWRFIGNYHGHNQDLSLQQTSRIIIYHFLKNLSCHEAIDQTVKSEAASILSAIEDKLSKISDNFDSLLDIKSKNFWSKSGVYPSDMDWLYEVKKSLNLSPS
jgi:hypothetical protein